MNPNPNKLTLPTSINSETDSSVYSGPVIDGERLQRSSIYSTSNPLQAPPSFSTATGLHRNVANSDEDISIGRNDGILIIVLYLPVHIVREPGTKEWSVTWDGNSLLARKKTTIADKLRFLWIGMPKLPPDTKYTHRERMEITVALSKLRCIPVFAKLSTRKLHEEYCRNTLHVCQIKDQNNDWQGYTALNQIFANKISETYDEGDFIWIQDIHFLVLPSFVARKLPKSNIGLYLYSPFPSSEIFRTLSVRDKLLRGMLNADHLGFPLFEYTRHFLACMFL
eukprot:GSMAST32.ASY1.ANO1.1798.1 assembled CDS